MGFYLLHQFNEIGHIHFGVHAAHDMHFGDGLAIVCFNDIEHLFDAEFPSVLLLRIEARVGAEGAAEHAYIGGLDMEIAVEISGIAVQPLADEIGQGAHKAGAALFKEEQSFRITDAFTILYFFCDRF